MASGSSIALVPIQVPVGATDILYSMRIATSEQDCPTGGNFHRNMSLKYNQIKLFGLPLYVFIPKSVRSKEIPGWHSTCLVFGL